MKILYLTGYRYPDSLNEPLTSGDLRYSFTLSRALAKLGHDVHVITRRDGNDPENSKLDGVNVHRYKSGLSRLFGTSFDISFNRFKLFKNQLDGADLIICNSALSMEHLVKIQAPIIYVASGLEDTKNYSLSLKEIIGYFAIKILRDPLKNLTWEKSMLVNTTAWYEAETLLNWGIPEEKIGKISSSIDTSRFMPLKDKGAEIRKALGIKSKDEIILSVSRFTPAKGVLETIRAFEKLNRKNAKLLLIGVHHSHDSTYYPRILNEIEKTKNKGNIILLENIPEHELPAYYSSADVTSVFSIGYDPLPTVIIESMACGTPVVSTYYKTREQFIRNHDTGIFVEEANLEDWVAKTKMLLDNRALRRKVSDNGLKYVRANFDYIEIAKKYTRIIET